VIAWHLLSTGEPYQDLGGDYFDKRRNSAARRADSSLPSKPWATKSPSNPPPDPANPTQLGAVV